MADIVIGGTVIKNGIMLAPMAGATDHAMRVMCRKYGADFAVTEMVSAKAMMFRDKKTVKLARIDSEDTPLAVQIFGSDPDIMAASARELATASYPGCETSELPAAIDINMGCPVQKIVKNGEGSALMKSPELASKIVRACVKALEGTGIPLTVKIRAGWESAPTGKNAAELAKMLEDAGAALICIHGRTREQFYAPSVDLDIIRSVKKAVSIPVIGNGDINSADDAERMMSYTGCDGVAIGRGALGNPFIFGELKAKFCGEEFTPPTVKERLDAAVEHTEILVGDKGDRIGPLEARKHFAWYIHGLKGATKIRDKIMRTPNYEEMKEIIYELLKENE